MEKVRLFSKDRLSKYMFDGDVGKALHRYEANLKVCSSFYIPLHTLEIILRNKIHLALSHSYSNDWLLKEMPLLGIEKSKVLKAVEILKYDKKEIVVPRIIAALSFSFWEHLFANKYESLWRKDLSKIFQQSPIKFTRKIFHMKIRQIRRLRNRIAHYECITHYPVEKYYSNLMECIEWLSPEMAIWAKQIDDLHEVINVYRQEYEGMKAYHYRK